MTKTGQPLYQTEPKDLRGINRFYDEDLYPKLAELDRLHTRAVLRAHMILFLVVPLVTGGLAFLITASGYYLSILAVPIFYLLIYIPQRSMGVPLPAWLAVMFMKLNYYAAREIKWRHKIFLLENLAEFLELEYSSEGNKKLARIHYMSGLLPVYDFVDCEDAFYGDEKGMEFEFTEARLIKKGHGSLRVDLQVFYGVLFRIQIRKRFKGHIVLRSTSARIPRKSGNGYETVTLEDVVFNKEFDVVATNQVYARYVLSPSVMERLLELKMLRPDLRVSFQDRSMSIAYSALNRFEAGGLFDDLDDPAHVREVLQDLTTVRKLAAAVGEIAEVRA